MFAKTMAFAFNVALPMLLVRRLDQAQFGVYKQLFLIIGTSVMVLPLGFAMSAYYFLPREPDRQRETVLNILIYNVVVGSLACGAFLLWPALLGIIFHQPGLTGYAPLIGLVILLWIVSQALEIIPIAHGEMKLASALIISVQLTRTVIYLAAVICVRIRESADLGGGGAGGPANSSSVVVFAVPFRRFLAASRWAPHAQPIVLRRAARPGRHTLYGADRPAQLFRFQPAGRRGLRYLRGGDGAVAPDNHVAGSHQCRGDPPRQRLAATERHARNHPVDGARHAEAGRWAKPPDGFQKGTPQLHGR